MGSFLQKIANCVPKPVRNIISEALPQGVRNRIRRAIYPSNSSGVIISNNGVKINSKTGDPIKPVAQGAETKVEHSESYKAAPNSAFGNGFVAQNNEDRVDVHLMGQLANKYYE